MRKTTFCTVITLVVTLTLNAQSPLKSVYDESIDPVNQIEQAVSRAKREGKFVVAQVGGNWCPWCLRFADFVTRDTTISQLIEDNFIYIHVNYDPRNRGDESRQQLTATAMSRLGNPIRFGFPVFVILDGESSILHTQDSSFLEEGKGYSRERVLRFFQCWTPEATGKER